MQSKIDAKKALKDLTLLLEESHHQKIISHFDSRVNERKEQHERSKSLMLKDAEVHLKTREIMKNIQREAEQLQNQIINGQKRASHNNSMAMTNSFQIANKGYLQ